MAPVRSVIDTKAGTAASLRAVTGTNRNIYARNVMRNNELSARTEK
jgi:hypothetical protein